MSATDPSESILELAPPPKVLAAGSVVPYPAPCAHPPLPNSDQVLTEPFISIPPVTSILTTSTVTTSASSLSPITSQSLSLSLSLSFIKS